MKKKQLELFMAKVEVTEGCWLWKAAINNSGYGVFDGQNAHRVAFNHWMHSIPEGLEIDHLCKVRYCVNPQHMRVVTHTENMSRCRQSLQTHCKYGHSLDTFYKNKRHGGKGYSRRCKICQSAATRRWYLKKKAIDPTYYNGKKLVHQP